MSALTEVRYTRRCTHCDPDTGERCGAQGTHWFTQHGVAYPISGAVCEDHGTLVVDEYSEKLPAFGMGLTPTDVEAA